MSKKSGKCEKNKKVDLLYDKDAEFENLEFYLESDRRDIYYSALIKDLIRNNRSSQLLKKIFFYTVCSVFVIICLTSLGIIYNISQKDSITYADIGVAIAGFGSVLGSIITLPQTIVKHLFPENSESVRFQFLNKVQRYDQMNIQAAEELMEELEETED